MGRREDSTNGETRRQVRSARDGQTSMTVRSEDSAEGQNSSRTGPQTVRMEKPEHKSGPPRLDRLEDRRVRRQCGWTEPNTVGSENASKKGRGETEEKVVVNLKICSRLSRDWTQKEKKVRCDKNQETKEKKIGRRAKETF